MLRVQRQLLRAVVLTEDKLSERDRRYIATLETLIELVWACKRKQPANRKVRGGGVKGQRSRGFCRFCGTLAELTSFAESADAEGKRRIDEELCLSNLYCEAHRPNKLPDKTWNPAYRKAKRSVAQFDLELLRVSRQYASRGTPQAKSGDELVDSCIHSYMLGQTLTLAEEADGT